MKVLTVSRFFPAYHPKKGEPTKFVEKIMAGLADNMPGWKMRDDFTIWDWYDYYNCTKLKHHTIMAGNRWKVGDMISLRIWSDKPYRSKQIEFAQVQVKKTWDFEQDLNGVYSIDGKYIMTEDYEKLAKNDGLTEDDMFCWFMPDYNKPVEFKGQIICWNENINY